MRVYFPYIDYMIYIQSVTQLGILFFQEHCTSPSSPGYVRPASAAGRGEQGGLCDGSMADRKFPAPGLGDCVH